MEAITFCRLGLVKPGSVVRARFEEDEDERRRGGPDGLVSLMKRKSLKCFREDVVAADLRADVETTCADLGKAIAVIEPDGSLIAGMRAQQ